MSFDGYLYHVARYKKMIVGQELVVGDKPNNFCLSICSKSFSVGEQDVNYLILHKDISQFSDIELSILKSYVYESCLMIRELVLENIRLTNFPDLPSRLKCLYCCNTLDDAKNWVNALKRMDKKNVPLQIVKLKVKGKVFEGDGSLMLRNTYIIDSKNIKTKR